MGVKEAEDEYLHSVVNVVALTEITMDLLLDIDPEEAGDAIYYLCRMARRARDLECPVIADLVDRVAAKLWTMHDQREHVVARRGRPRLN